MNTKKMRCVPGPGYVSGVCVDEIEIVRRVFVTVRDRAWREITPIRCCIDFDDARGILTLGARHTNELVDFEWSGTLQLQDDPPGFRFAFEGQVLRDMEICRLGLIVLHSVKAMVGAQLTAVGPHGTQRLMVSAHIHPQPIVAEVPGAMTEPFTALSIEQAAIGRLRLDFTGDLFELEDQRNWGDASFKTYCTPLRLGFPLLVRKGATIRQSVQATFFSDVSVDSARRAAVVTPPNSLSEASAGAQRRQQIGCLAPGLSHRAVSTVTPVLGWDHVQVDWSSEEPDAIVACVAALPPSCKLEVVLSISDEKGLSDRLVATLEKHSAQIARVLLRDVKRALPTPEAVAGVRLRLLDSPRVPLFALPNGYFVELNRDRRFDLDVDGIAFPVSSTVHSDDVETILENIDAIADMVETASRITGRTQIAICPLALYWPNRSGHQRFPNSLVRQWILGSIARASGVGVVSITLADDVLAALA